MTKLDEETNSIETHSEQKIFHCDMPAKPTLNIDFYSEIISKMLDKITQKVDIKEIK